jgi:hypothetical protein
MASRQPAAEVVVVHCRQVVVDERVGVDHLHGAGAGQSLLDRSPTGLGGQQEKDRAQPLPRRQEAIANSRAEGYRTPSVERRPAPEARVHQRAEFAKTPF